MAKQYRQHHTMALIVGTVLIASLTSGCFRQAGDDGSPNNPKAWDGQQARQNDVRYDDERTYTPPPGYPSPFAKKPRRTTPKPVRPQPTVPVRPKTGATQRTHSWARYHRRSQRLRARLRTCRRAWSKARARRSLLLAQMQIANDIQTWRRYNGQLAGTRMRMWRLRRCVEKKKQQLARLKRRFWNKSRRFAPPTPAQPVARPRMAQAPRPTRLRPSTASPTRLRPSTASSTRLRASTPSRLRRSTTSLAKVRRSTMSPTRLRAATPSRPTLAQRPTPAAVQPAPIKAVVQPAVSPQGPLTRTMHAAWQAQCLVERKQYPKNQVPRLLKRLQRQDPGGPWQLSLLHNASGDNLRPLWAANGRYTFLGKGGRYSIAHCSDRSFYLWDGQKHKMVRAQPKVTDFLMKHPTLLPWFNGQRRAVLEEQLVYFDPAKQQGGLLLRVPFITRAPGAKKQRRYRYFYLHWDMRTQEITKHWELGRHGCVLAYRILGVDPQGQKLYYFQREAGISAQCGRRPIQNQATPSPKTQHLRLYALALQSGQRMGIVRFSHRFRLENIVPSRDFTKIAVVEYTELKQEKGHVYLIDTSIGALRKLPAPHAAYGSVFSPDQKRLLLYGSKNGNLVEVTLGGLYPQRKFKAYRRGHAIGFSRDGQQFYIINHSGVQIRDAATLKPTGYLSHRKIFGKSGFLHVGGSVIHRGTLFVKNGDKLYTRAQRLTTAKPKPKRISLVVKNKDNR